MFTGVVPEQPSGRGPPGSSLPPLPRHLSSVLELDDGASPRKLPLTRALSRRLSKQASFRRQSTQRNIVAPKPEIPETLLKFLQKTSEQQTLVDAVKATLGEDPATRNEQSVDLVYDWMMHNCQQYSNNIFGSAPEYIRREICRQMKLITIKSQDLIIRQGDTGDRCYIVIDGIVDVYIQKESSLDSPRRLSRRMSSTLLESQGSGPLGSNNGGGRIPVGIEYGDMVANLGPGAMFGEIVLLNPSARRNATILASQYTASCDLICLERADYIRLVRTASMEASHYNNAVILDHMYFFRAWEKHDKMRLVSASRSLHFAANDHLYRAGSEAKWMFIVTSGEVKERMSWSLSSMSSASTTGAGSSTGSDPANGAAMRALFMQTAKKNPERVVNVELLLVGPGDLVGEVPIVTSRRSAPFDIKAVTDVQVLAIDRRFFETVMVPATREQKPAVHATVHHLRKLARDREDWRQQRIACGIAYPNAPVTITWQLMRMSNGRCARCGQRGHLVSDTSRCEMTNHSAGHHIPLPAAVLVPGTARSHRIHSRALSPVKFKLSKPAPPATAAAGHHTEGARVNRQRNATASALRELFDDSFLPTPHELLEQCRNVKSPRVQELIGSNSPSR